MTGKLKIAGNILAAQKLQQLWAEEAPRGSVSLDEPSEETSILSSNQNQNLDDKALLEVSLLISYSFFLLINFILKNYFFSRFQFLASNAISCLLFSRIACMKNQN
jgi:hypothetical protein